MNESTTVLFWQSLVALMTAVAALVPALAAYFRSRSNEIEARTARHKAEELAVLAQQARNKADTAHIRIEHNSEGLVELRNEVRTVQTRLNGNGLQKPPGGNGSH